MSNINVKRNQQKEQHSTDHAVDQFPDMDITDGITRDAGIVVAREDVESDFVRDLRFNEDAVTIILHENSRTDSPETHVMCSVNGKGAEVLVNGKWMEMLYLPVGVELTTKRKYVERFLQSKTDAVRTVHDDTNVEKPRNMVNRSSSARYPLSVLNDPNPSRGGAWLAQMSRGH